ncbi:hypothetical protein MRX96_046117 [Rhipicephalus microplus]
MAFPLSAAEIILALVAGFLVYIYTARHQNIWKSQNVVHEKPSFIFGAIERLLLKPMCLIDQERYKKFGRVFGAFEQGKPCLFVAEPDLIKQVLVKDFTRLPNRVLGKTSIPLRKMNSMIQKCAMIMSNHLNEAAETKEDVDLRRLYGHYTLDVIARCAFGTIINSHVETSNVFVENVNKLFSERRMSWRIAVAMLFPGLMKYFRFNTQNPANYEFFTNVCERIMKERRQAGKRHEDFLQLMMDAQEGCLASAEDSTEEPENEIFDVGCDTKLSSTKNNKRLSELEATAQCVIFFLSGQEAVSTTITFAAYHLALNPVIQEKLQKEVEECIAANAISETLRILPIASRLERCGYEDYVLGDTGIKLPKGCTVYIPVYALHHDPEFFPDPESFKPERFSEENVGSIRPYTYLPFGAGPRNCIGNRFVILTIKLCLFHSVRSVEFTRTSKTKVPLSIKRGHGGLCTEDVTLGIQKRRDQRLGNGGLEKCAQLTSENS